MYSVDLRVNRLYNTVGCVFNHRSFYANIQADDTVFNVRWNFDDELDWKAMEESQVCMVQPSMNAGYLSLIAPPSQLDVVEMEKSLETALRAKIAYIREDHGFG